MNVTALYPSDLKSSNTDIAYNKNFIELNRIDDEVRVSVLNGKVSAYSCKLGSYATRLARDHKYIKSLFSRRILVLPHERLGADVIISRYLVPVQIPGMSVPLVLHSGHPPSEYFGLEEFDKESPGIRRKLKEVRSASTTIFSTQEQIDRICELDESVRNSITYVPYFLPELESIEKTSLDEKFDCYDIVKIIFVGGDGQRKGLHSLIESIKVLVANNKSLAKRIYLEVVSQTNPGVQEFPIVHYKSLSHDKVMAKMRKSHIFCMPTKKDSYGLVFIEAMAAGCAIIADNSPTRREILANGDAGLLSDPYDTADIAEKLAILIDSPDYASQLAERARQRFLQYYHWRVVGEQYVDLLHRVAR